MATIIIRFFLFCFSPRVFFPFFSSVATFSHRRSARIKKLIKRKLTGVPKNLGVHPLPDFAGHFGTLWWQFWIFEVVIEGVLGSKTYLEKVDGSAQKPRCTPLSRPPRPFWGPLVAILDFRALAQKECLDLKTYLEKVDGSAPKPRGTPLSRPRRPFWGPLAAILDF